MQSPAEDTNQTGPILLQLSQRTQWIVLIVLQLAITLLHNAIPMPSAAFLMVLTQKLFFIPVILAGFWFGLLGGLGSALIAAVFYPHYAMSHLHDMPGLSINDVSDIALLFIVGGITGWLRDLLNGELKRHRTTAERLDQALAEVTHSYERAARAERLAALGQMAAGVAHEVRNPLTSMQGAVDILRRSLQAHPERAETLLTRLQSEIAHLDSITKHFLEFARPPGATLQPLSPHQLVANAVKALRQQAQARTLALDFASEGEQAIMGDRDQLRQVIVNLLLNAIDFADPHSTIEVQSNFIDGQWVLAVTNRGETIAAEHRERIFEPFFTTRAEGTGLGLAIAARIAEAHEGTLECASAAHTTCFTLSIPENRPS